jgi:hypothetical protein
MFKKAKNWLDRLIASLVATQEDKQEHSEASFPYHDGIKKQYFEKPKTEDQ